MTRFSPLLKHVIHFSKLHSQEFENVVITVLKEGTLYLFICLYYCNFIYSVFHATDYLY